MVCPLLIRCITLTDFCILSQPCILEVNPSQSRYEPFSSLGFEDITRFDSPLSSLDILLWSLLIFPTSKHWNGPGLSPRSCSFLCLQLTFCVMSLCFVAMCYLYMLQTPRIVILCSYPSPGLHAYVRLHNPLLGCVTDIPYGPKPNSRLPPHTCSSPIFSCLTKWQLHSFLCSRQKEMELFLISLSHTLKCLSSFVFQIFQNLSISHHFLNYHAVWSKPASSLIWMLALASSLSCLCLPFPTPSQLFYIASKAICLFIYLR